jgi:hypothetical protein
MVELPGFLVLVSRDRAEPSGPLALIGDGLLQPLRKSRNRGLRTVGAPKTHRFAGKQHRAAAPDLCWQQIRLNN